MTWPEYSRSLEPATVAEKSAPREKRPLRQAVLRPSRVRWCFGKTPMQPFTDSLGLAREKLLSEEQFQQSA